MNKKNNINTNIRYVSGSVTSIPPQISLLSNLSEINYLNRAFYPEPLPAEFWNITSLVQLYVCSFLFMFVFISVHVYNSFYFFYFCILFWFLFISFCVFYFVFLLCLFSLISTNRKILSNSNSFIVPSEISQLSNLKTL